MCQYEGMHLRMPNILDFAHALSFADTVNPYLAAAKHLYKDFASVRRNKSTGLVEIASLSYRITRVETASARANAVSDGHVKDALFPTESPHHVCLVSIDSAKRSVTVFYSG